MVVYFTRAGYELQIAKASELERKLKELQKGVQGSFDDGRSIHDNANYETQVHEIEIATRMLATERQALSQASIIQYPDSLDKVCLGAEVTMRLDGERKTIQIVAYGESDPNVGKIFYAAPMAKAIIGLEPGEEVTAQIGNKSRTIAIEKVGPVASPTNASQP